MKKTMNKLAALAAFAFATTFGLSAWAGNVAQVTIGDVTTPYTSLQDAFNAVAACTDTKSAVTLEMLDDVTVTTWTAVKVPNGLSYVQSLTIKGNNKTITGITEPLISRAWQGESLEINDLTIANANIVDYNSDDSSDYGTGAFIGYAEATSAITLKNCHVTGGTISGAHWCGGLVGYCSQVYPLTFDGCSVENANISFSDGSTGGLIGHATGDQRTRVIVKGNSIVSGNTITGENIEKTGVLFGTIGSGQHYIDSNANNKEYFGGVFVENITVANNAVGTDREKRIFGRIGSEGGTIKISGGSFSGVVIQNPLDTTATFEISGGTYNVNPPKAYLAAGAEVTDNGNNTWTVQVAVAKVGETKYSSLAAALEAVAADPENKTLSWVAESVWAADKEVYYNGNFSTMSAAIVAACEANSADPAQLFVRPNYSGLTVAHDLLKTSITIYGNNASVNAKWQPSIEKPGDESLPNGCHTLTKNVHHRIYSLHHGAGFWGSRCSTYEVSLEMVNCQDAFEIMNYPASDKGVTNVRLVNCSFDGSSSYGNNAPFTNKNPGTTWIEGCSFANTLIALNACMDFGNDDSTLGLTVKNCTFTNCTGEGAAKGVIRTFGAAGSQVNVTVDGCTFTNCSTTNPNVSLGKNDATENKALVAYTIKNTAATVNAYTQGTADLTSFTVKATETVTGDTAPAVAQIVETGVKYPTLEAAIAAAATGGLTNTIKMLANYQASDRVVITENKAIVLDLNGKTVSGAVTYNSDTLGFFFINNGDLVITDMSDGQAGRLYNATTSFGSNRVSHYGDVWSSASAKLTINGGSFGGTTAGNAVRSYGDCVINGGTFTINPADRSDKNKSDYTIANYGTMIVNGGQLVGSQRGHFSCAGEMVVNDITITGTKYMYNFYVYNDGSVVVKGGSFVSIPDTKNCSPYFFFTSSGSLTIEDGSFTAGNYAQYSKTFQINVGSVKPVLKGGTYNVNPSPDTTAQIADGYMVNANGTSPETWTVIPAVAKIGNNLYASVAEATSAAEDGDIVEILADSVELALSGLNSKHITYQGQIDENGKPTTTVTGLSKVTGDEQHLVMNTTLRNFVFRNSTWNTMFFHQTFDGTTFDNCKFTGSNGVRMAYLSNDFGTSVFTNCVVDSTVYGIHLDGAAAAGGHVRFVDSDLVGWNSYGESITSLTFDRCRFVDKANNPYHVCMIYGDNLFITNSSFAASWCVVDGYQTVGIAGGTGTAHLDNCTVASGTVAELCLNSEMSGVVAIDSTKNDLGKYTAGTFVTDATSLIPVADGYELRQTATDHIWSIVELAAQVISVDGATTNRFGTLQAAFNAVEANETVEALKDNSESITITKTVPFTFKSNGHSMGAAPTVPQDWKFVKNGDVCTYQAKVYVAQIVTGTQTNKYESLADAVAAVPEDGETATTITMIANETMAAETTVTIANKNIVLDLNGKTISGSGDAKTKNFYLVNIGIGASVIIDDSSEKADGVITMTPTAVDTGYGKESCTIYNCGGMLTLRGGKVVNGASSGLAYAINNSSNAWADPIVSTFLMEGGQVSAPNGDAALRIYQNAYEQVSVNCVKISGGEIVDTGLFVDTFSYEGHDNSKTMTTVEITGGTINGLVDCKLRNDKLSFTISGGNFTNTKLWVRNKTDESVISTLTQPVLFIEGGTFAFVSGKAFGLAYDCEGTSWDAGTEPYAVTGGTFSVDPKEHIVSGRVASKVTIDETDWWVVGEVVDTGDGSTAVVVVDHTSSVDVEQTAEVMPTEVAAKFNQNTEVTGVKLVETNETITVSGTQAVVDKARLEGSAAFRDNLKAGTNVLVNVDVAVKPTVYVAPAQETKAGEIAFTLTPVATVTVDEGGDNKTQEVEVTNDMIDQLQNIVVTVYTGFKPEQAVHTGDDGKVIYTFTGDEITYDETTGNASVIIHHFSSLTFSQKPAVASVNGTPYATLAAAFAAADDGETVTLLTNVVLDACIVVSNQVTLDIGAYNVTATSNLTDGKDTLFSVKYGADFTVNGTTGKISSEAVSSIYSAIGLTEKGDVYDGTNRAKLTVNANLTGYYFAIAGNGGRPGTDIVVNGGTITAVADKDNLGIFNPQCDSTVVVNGGTIRGYSSAIEMRGGTLTVNGGTLEATAPSYSIAASGSGNTTVGAALAIAQHTTKGDISVTVNGGSFKGVRAFNEADPQSNKTDNVSVAIKGGAFTGVVAAADVTKYISGGTFSEPVTQEQCKDWFKPVVKGDGTYGVEEQVVFLQNLKGATRYPWNGKVDVTFQLQAARDVKLFVAAFDATSNRVSMTSAQLVAPTEMAINCSTGFVGTATAAGTWVDYHLIWNSTEVVESNKVEGISFKVFAR